MTSLAFPTQVGALEIIHGRPPLHDLNRDGSVSIQMETRSFPMVAIAIIFAFIAVLAAVNYYEFGRVD